jgi:hypothetical protein
MGLQAIKLWKHEVVKERKVDQVVFTCIPMLGICGYGAEAFSLYQNIQLVS